MKKIKRMLTSTIVIVVLGCFVLPMTTTAASMLGDASQDGAITAEDARMVLRFSVALDFPTDAQLMNCDVDGDGILTASDARTILRVSVDLEAFDKTETETELVPETELTINSEDLENLAIVVCQEAGGLPEDIQLLVANVVLNRLNSRYYPNTVYEVLTQPWQYERVTKEGGIYWPDWADDGVKEQCRFVAYRILSGERVCPENVVYQAGFEQGSGIYLYYETVWWLDDMYFCYW